MVTPAQSRESADELQASDSAADLYRKLALGHIWTITFNDFAERPTRDPKVTQRDPKRVRGRPKTPQTEIKGRAKEGQRKLNGSPEGPKGGAWHSMGLPRRTI